MPSKIEWTDETWNPAVGCTKCSPGCLNCYAERMAYRQCRMADARCEKNRSQRNLVTGMAYDKAINKNTRKWTGEIGFNRWVLNDPLHWKNPRRIFVCSMSDLFHPKVPFEFITKVLRIIEQCPQHTFLILTKRPEIAFDFYGGTSGAGLSAPPLSNVHFGVSISTPDELWKVDELKKIPAAVRFLSLEPLLAGIEFTYDHLYCDRDPEEDSPVACVPCPCGKHWENGFISGTTLNCIDWVVCGGESGLGARPMHPDWARGIRDQCVAADVPFFFKQWGEWMPFTDDVERYGSTWGCTAYNRSLKRMAKAHGASILLEDRPDGWDDIMLRDGEAVGKDLMIGRVGKKKAGCLLDGKEWKQYPK